jgi:hypothetical protein
MDLDAGGVRCSAPVSSGENTNISCWSGNIITNSFQHDFSSGPARVEFTQYPHQHELTTFLTILLKLFYYFKLRSISGPLILIFTNVARHVFIIVLN